MILRRFFIIFFITYLLSLPIFSQTLKSRNIDKVLKELNIKQEDCYYDLVVEKDIPYLSGKSVIVFPKIVEKRDDNYLFDSYILIVDSHSGQIMNKFYENHAWTSDAIILKSIGIDFAPYILNSKVRAFGIKLSYSGDSRLFPYSGDDISLFYPKDSLLIRVLKKFSTYSYHGQLDRDCYGTYITETKTLIISDRLTNNFNDIIVKNKITTTKLIDCNEKDSVAFKKVILQFDDKIYK